MPRGRKSVEEEKVEEISLSVEELDVVKVPLPGTGETIKARITKIVRGKLGDLIDIESIRNPVVRERMAQKSSRYALQIWYEIDGMEYRETLLYSLHPNSKLVQLLKKYGELKKGMEIEVTINERGYPRIAV